MFPHHSITRRRAIKFGVAGFVGLSTAAATRVFYGTDEIQVVDDTKRNFKVNTKIPLKDRAAAKGVLCGAAANYPSLSSNPTLRKLFAQECSILVAENELKWDVVRPTPDKFDFTKGDWFLNFARAHGMKFRGVHLVWNQANPKWVKELVNRQNAEKILVEHITTVAKHYAGKVHSWDVVNEAISVPYSNRADGLQHSPWLTHLGENYIELAFQAAAAADPDAILVHNEGWVDYDTPRDEAQRKAVLKLLERLKSKGIPIHALGIQGHLHAHQARFNPQKFRAFLKDVADFGLKIMITELDAVDSKLPVDITKRDRLVARAYEDYLSVVLDEKAVISVITWGLSDRYTWLSRYNPRPDGAPVRPLPLDSNYQRKLVWNAMARAFDNAPNR
jgi:endo-1,4-beta-xylanase